MKTRRVWVWVTCAVMALSTAAACAPDRGADGSRSGTTVLNWYAPPDRISSSSVAATCSTEDYDIAVHELPADAGESRAQLVRRLAAKDTSIDLIGLDTAMTAEFAAAKLLAPVPDDLEPAFAESVFDTALAASTFDGELVTVPWVFEPQLLWFRSAAAERAGLDMTKPIRWDDLIAGAQRAGVSIEIDDADGTGLTRWISGLIEEAGGQIVDGAGRDAAVGMDSGPAQTAASVIELYQESAVGTGPSPEALASFAGPRGGFLLASPSAISDPAVGSVATNMKWAPSPTIDAASTPQPALSGQGLAVSLYSSHSELAFEAIQCLTASPTMSTVMVSTGHGSARASTYDTNAVKAAYPMANTVRTGTENGAALPQTPYWWQIHTAIEGTWSPLAGVNAAQTPDQSQRAVEALLAGELP